MIPVLPLERKGKRRHSAVSLGREEKIALRGGGEWSESEEPLAVKARKGKGSKDISKDQGAA